jgi:tetratricopeptide (TPR) repeat protein
MSMKVSRAWKVAAVVLVVAAAAGLAAVYTRSNRDVTTSSEAAYQAWREAIQNERRFYFKEARLGFARALELDPQFAMAMIGLARNSDTDQRLALVKRAARERSRLNEHERLHIDLVQADLDHDEARFFETAEKIHAKYPDDIRAAQILAGRAMRTQKSEEALRIFAEVLAIDPNNADAYNQIGYYYGYRGDYDRAIENLKRYQFMAPDQANPYDSLGEIMANSGHYDEAIDNLNKALALKPDFFESYAHLGIAYEGKGETARAIEMYERASKESVSQAGAIDYLVRAYRTAAFSGDAARAQQIFGMIEKAPHDKSLDAQWEIGRQAAKAVLLSIEGRHDQAEATLLAVKPMWDAEFVKNNKNTSYKPYWPFYNCLLAKTRAAQGKTDEAIALYEQMVNPPNPWGDFQGRRWVYEARASLAELLARKGELDRADKLLAENHKWNPSWAPSRAAELVVAEAHRERVQAASK